MNLRRLTAAATAALICTLTACSPSGGQESPAGAAKPAETSPSENPSPSPSDDGPYKLGELWEWTASDPKIGDAAGTTTVLSYRQDVDAFISAAESIGQDGYVWAALEVKVCTTKGKVYVSNMPWTLSYADGARVQPSGVTHSDFPQPEYPYAATIVKPGDCVRGNIVFPAPGDQRPESAVYAPTSGEELTAIEWTIPSA